MTLCRNLDEGVHRPETRARTVRPFLRPSEKVIVARATFPADSQRSRNLDRLGAGGLQFTRFCSPGRCCPTRASLLTGLYSHQAGVGRMEDPWE
ncbi:MAG: sulfatase-like hydrolase/transferase [Planctomycetaceae bacterium]|nr:sulfatase-like hydrolase/transferase [Planctomycetaceae bacterium]